MSNLHVRQFAVAPLTSNYGKSSVLQMKPRWSRAIDDPIWSLEFSRDFHFALAHKL